MFMFPIRQEARTDQVASTLPLHRALRFSIGTGSVIRKGGRNCIAKGSNSVGVREQRGVGTNYP